MKAALTAVAFNILLKLLLVGTFAQVGLALATASNQQVDFRILAYHATWHIVSAIW